MVSLLVFLFFAMSLQFHMHCVLKRKLNSSASAKLQADENLENRAFSSLKNCLSTFKENSQLLL